MTPDASTAATALLAVHSVDEFVFSVPDLEAARQFYASFGLDVRDEDGGLALYAFGHPQRWGRIRQAAGRKRLLWLSLGIHEGRAALRRTPGSAGHRAHHRARRRGRWRHLDRRSRRPAATAARRAQVAVGAGAADPATALRQCRPRPSRSRARVQPLYLSHILLFSADVARATRFYVDVLGLRVSDTSGDVIAFLHSPHGSDHHLIALAKSGGLGLHHTSWCVASLDDVGLGMEQMSAAGHGEGWGVGRHVLGSNYFRYVRDPGAATPSIPTTSISSRPARHGPRPTIRPRTRCTSGGLPCPGLHHEPRTGRLSGGCPTPTGNEAGGTPRPPAAPAAPPASGARAAPRP